jgi:hypothetical protein
LLARAVKKGHADRVMRGVYVSRTGQFSEVEPDPYLVAAAVSHDVVMVYHSALELHGLAHSPSRRVQFISSRLSTRFAYRDFEYERYQRPALPASDEDARFTTLVARPQGVVRVRIPVQADHPFRPKPISDSARSRSLIPEQADHPFRPQADHFRPSGRNRI